MLNGVGNPKVRQRMNFRDRSATADQERPNRILTDDKLDIIVTANSPGEVATWLVPTLKALKERLPSAEHSLHSTLHICQRAGASGGSGLPGVKRTFNKRQLLSFILTGKGYLIIPLAPRGLVLFLGV